MAWRDTARAVVFEIIHKDNPFRLNKPTHCRATLPRRQAFVRALAAEKRTKQESAGMVELGLHDNGTASRSCVCQCMATRPVPESFLSMAFSSRSAVDLLPIVESSLCDKAGRRSDCRLHRSAVSFQR